MKIIILFISCLILTSFSFGQSLMNKDNLASFKSGDLTTTQLIQIQSELIDMNMTITDLRALSIQKGMPPNEFDLLVERLEKLEEGSGIDKSAVEKLPYQHIPLTTRTDFEKKEGWIFGSEIFTNKALSFEPNQALSNPDAYVLGAGDELQVVIYGVQEYTQTVRVSKNGSVFLSNIGAVNVGGLQVGAARQLIEKKATGIFQTLASGRSELSVTISDFKTIQVTLIGAVQPGNYAVSSLSTVFNVLHIAGGPNVNGSYRNIELIRNNAVYKTIDLYDFIIAGDLSSNVALQNNDIIRIPTYTKRVEVIGEVKRPGMFELEEDEGFDDLLKYCAGFTENAYLKNIQLSTTTDTDLKIKTIPKEAFSSLQFKSGDQLNVGRLLMTYQNKVRISGAVYRPFGYELDEDMRVLDLLLKADGLTEDAFGQRAILIREGNQLQGEVIGIDLLELLENPSSENNVLLKKNDELVVSSLSELKENQTVFIAGEVLNAGEFNFTDKLTLYDLIILSGGLKESASNKVEVARIADSNAVYTEIITLEIDRELQSNKLNIELRPNDIVSIRKKLNYQLSEQINIVGEVNYPGTYAIRSNDERICDLISRAGGLNQKANPQGIKVIRRSNVNGASDEDNSLVVIPIDFEKIRKNPNSKANISLQKGDEIYVERLVQTTAVLGEVAMETEIPIEGAKRAKYYINSSGGFTEKANKKKTYVIYANGIAKTTKNFGLFKVYPKPTFGSAIVVPEKTDKPNKLTTQEVIALSTVLSSVTGITIAIITLIKP